MSIVKKICAVMTAAVIGAGVPVVAGASAQATDVRADCVASFTPANGGINPSYVAYTANITCQHPHYWLKLDVQAWDGSFTGNQIELSQTAMYGRRVSLTFRYAPLTPNRWGFVVAGFYHTDFLQTLDPVSVAAVTGPLVAQVGS
jgi:hypothetical protein